jgi:hypothetical protein
LKVFLRTPDSGLVDEPCVRLILLYREGELRCESYSWARDLLESKIITSLENDLGKLAWALTLGV